MEVLHPYKVNNTLENMISKKILLLHTTLIRFKSAHDNTLISFKSAHDNVLYIFEQL